MASLVSAWLKSRASHEPYEFAGLKLSAPVPHPQENKTASEKDRNTS
jgi:hypothetical protein